MTFRIVLHLHFSSFAVRTLRGFIAFALLSTALSSISFAQLTGDAPVADARQIAQIRAKSKGLSAAQIGNARQFFSAAFSAYQAKRLDEAALLFEKGLAINPGDADAQYFYAQVLRDSNKKPEALAAFTLSAALAPDSVNGTFASIEARKLVPPKAGQSFRDCPACPEMVIVPAGTFIMGSPESERATFKAAGGTDERFDWSRPEQQIALPSFSVGKFEVTFTEFDACVDDGQCTSPADQGWGRGNLPVVNVSHDDALRYVVWLTKKTGQKYRLLSESEWEYAARAGCKSAFSVSRQCKDTISADEANFNANKTYNGGVASVYRQRTVLAGSLNSPNAWGLHDMHGNVGEWVQDCFSDSLVGMPRDGGARSTGCSNSTHRVLRGGTWGFGPSTLRAGHRDRLPGASKSEIVGFRVARTLFP